MAVMRSTHATAGSAAEFSVAARLQHAERLFTNGHADEARHQLEDLLVHTSDDPALRLQALTDLAVINARTGRLGEGAAPAMPPHPPGPPQTGRAGGARFLRHRPWAGSRGSFGSPPGHARGGVQAVVDLRCRARRAGADATGLDARPRPDLVRNRCPIRMARVARVLRRLCVPRSRASVDDDHDRGQHLLQQRRCHSMRRAGGVGGRRLPVRMVGAAPRQRLS
jgi:hypothetical protein